MSRDGSGATRSPSGTPVATTSPLCGCFTGLRKLSEDERGSPAASKTTPAVATLPGTPTYKQDDEQHFELLHSAMCGIVDTATALLHARADVRQRDSPLGRTALMWAAQRGHADAVRLFLACSASVCDVDGEGRSALMLSAEAGHAESAQLLLGSLAAVDDRCQYGMTALLYAASEGRTNTLGALLDGGADTNAHDDIFGMTPMMLAAAGDHVSSVSLLLERRARAEMKDSDGRTALMHAAERGCPEVVETLLRVRSAGRDEEDPHHRRTALGWAQHANRSAAARNGVLRRLLGHTESDDLHRARDDLQAKVVRLLTESRARVDACVVGGALAGDAAAGSTLQRARLRAAAAGGTFSVIEELGKQKLASKGGMPLYGGERAGDLGRLDRGSRVLSHAGLPQSWNMPTTTQIGIPSTRSTSGVVGPRVLYGAMDG